MKGRPRITTAEQDQEIRVRAANGETNRQISEAMNVPFGVVTNRAGGRGRGCSQETRERIRTLFRQGMSAMAIAREFEVSLSLVYRHLGRLGCGGTPAEKVELVRKLLAVGATHREIRKVVGLSLSLISQIRNLPTQASQEQESTQ